MVLNLDPFLGSKRLHDQGFFLGRAGIGATAAAGAVQGADLDAIPQSLKLLALGFLRDKILRRVFKVFFCGQHRSNHPVGTDKSALVALDAVFRLPFRNIDGDAPFFIAGGGCRENAVRRHGTHRKLVSLLAQHGSHDIGHKFRFVLFQVRFMACRGPGFGDLDFFQRPHGPIHGIDVHLNHLVALFAVGFFDGPLHVIKSLFGGDDIGNLKKCRLHDHVDAGSQAQLGTYFYRVNIVKFQFFEGDGALYTIRNTRFHLLQGPGGVQQKSAAFPNTVQDVVFFHKRRVMTGDKVRMGQQVRGLNLMGGKPEVAHGDAAGFFGVVGKISLSKHIGIFADDFDGILVGPHGSISAQTPELAPHGALGGWIDLFTQREGRMAHIVHNTHGKMILGTFGAQVIKNRFNHVGRKILTAEAITPPHDDRRRFFPFLEEGAYILVQGFTQSARGFGPVQYADALYGSRQRLQEVLR